MDHGLGKHVWVAPKDAGVVWAKGLFVSEVSYTGIICSIKFSLLAFYWRIFKQSKIRIPIYILGTVVSCWGIAVVSVFPTSKRSHFNQVLISCLLQSSNARPSAVSGTASHPHLLPGPLNAASTSISSSMETPYLIS